LIGYWPGSLPTNITKHCAYTAMLLPLISFSGRFVVTNAGTAGAAATQTKFFLSTNTALDTGDILVDTLNCIPLSTNQATSLNFQFSLPAGVSSRGKYLIGVVNAGSPPIHESNTNNNIRVLGPLP
jgi:hypothetical protein